MDLVPSEPRSKPSPRFLLIPRFAHNPLRKILLRQNHIQETIARRNRIKNLLHHITALGERFATTGPDGVEDLRNQQELIEYVIISPRAYSVLNAEFLPENLMVLKDDCGHCTRAKARSSALVIFRVATIWPGFFGTYKRPSLTIRFALDLVTLFNVDTGNSLHTGPSFRRENTNGWWAFPLPTEQTN